MDKEKNLKRLTWFIIGSVETALLLLAFVTITRAQVRNAPPYEGPMDGTVYFPVTNRGFNYSVTAQQLKDSLSGGGGDGKNIYNSDGTLDNNRSLDGNAKNLFIHNNSSIWLNVGSDTIQQFGNLPLTKDNLPLMALSTAQYYTSNISLAKIDTLMDYGEGDTVNVKRSLVSVNAGFDNTIGTYTGFNASLDYMNPRFSLAWINSGYSNIRVGCYNQSDPQDLRSAVAIGGSGDRGKLYIISDGDSRLHNLIYATNSLADNRSDLPATKAVYGSGFISQPDTFTMFYNASGGVGIGERANFISSIADNTNQYFKFPNRSGTFLLDTDTATLLATKHDLSSENLQKVTDRGNATTNEIIASALRVKDDIAGHYPALYFQPKNPIYGVSEIKLDENNGVIKFNPFNFDSTTFSAPFVFGSQVQGNAATHATNFVTLAQMNDSLEGKADTLGSAAYPELTVYTNVDNDTVSIGLNEENVIFDYAVVANLPAASSAPGKVYRLVSTYEGGATIGNGFVDTKGNDANTLIRGQWVYLQSDGTEWVAIMEGGN